MTITFDNSAGNVSRTDNGYYLVKVTVDSVVQVVAIKSVVELKAHLITASGISTTLETIESIADSVSPLLVSSAPLEDTLDAS